ncbi:MAG: alpha/beta fold hydrolase [Pseudomonadota bacterium]
MTNKLFFSLALVVWCFVASGCMSANECNALSVEKTNVPLIHSDQRSTEFTIFSPEKQGVYPLIVFSHGAYSAPERYDALLRGLAATGFVVVAPLHIDSELLTAGTAPPPHSETWSTRKEDIALPLSRVASLQAALTSAQLADPADGYLAAGHSYGAFVAQTLGGARAIGEQPETDSRLVGMIAFSPPGPIQGFIGDDAWQSIATPQLVLTGTADVLPGFIDDWRAHAIAHQQPSAGDQWLWVGRDVDHYFGRVIGRLTRDTPPQSVAFTNALAVSASFAAAAANTQRRGCLSPLKVHEDDVASLTRR